MSNSYNKVYVNPNFNKSSTVSALNMQNSKRNMHINPKFSQNILQNQNRIYVNPIFVKSSVNNLTDNVVGSCSHIINHDKVINDTNYRHIHEQVSLNTETKPPTISNSRYSLVRHSGSMKANSQVSTKVTTVKINKYKTVAIKSLQNKVNTNNILQVSQIPNLDKKQLYSRNMTSTRSEYKTSVKTLLVSKDTVKKYKNKYKIYKRESQSKLPSINKPINRSLSADKKNSKAKYLDRKCMKKNNIPCPLYKKYGKCLRSINGNCDFLHDKKHVSVCRKFIKGVCHDKNCLLSHELSTNKMPTCYFYLNGMCTKMGCPYLHVKLNEKAKLCPEFLKGYCEKGDLCLNRHINKELKTLRSKVINKRLRSLQKINKPNTSNVYKLKYNVNNKCDKVSSKEDEANVEQSSATVDCRYYQDVSNTVTNDTDESIKPTKCKLGILPSYIKL